VMEGEGSNEKKRKKTRTSGKWEGENVGTNGKGGRRKEKRDEGRG
jgi:hypothetical protein